jgi:hypothetical protein
MNQEETPTGKRLQMSKNGNTNVTALPLVARLRVRSMATKCAGVCGTCNYMGCAAQEECAIEISNNEGGKAA